MGSTGARGLHNPLRYRRGYHRQCSARGAVKSVLMRAHGYYRLCSPRSTASRYVPRLPPSPASLCLSCTGEDAIRLFSGARPNGDNDILPTLRYREGFLESKIGDLVIAIFGGGDLGNAKSAIS